MTGILKTASGFLFKTLYFMLQYLVPITQWVWRFVKVRLRSWKKCGVQKELDKALKDLGTEVYSLSIRNEADWQNMPSVKQQVARVKDAEARLLQVDEQIEAIKENYSKRKEEIKEKYASKRAGIGAGED